MLNDPLCLLIAGQTTRHHRLMIPGGQLAIGPLSRLVLSGASMPTG